MSFPIFPKNKEKDLNSYIVLTILKDYVKALDTKDRKIIKEWKDNFLMKYHRNKFRGNRFKDGELAFYIFEYLFKKCPLICNLWFKQDSVIPDFKSYTNKKSFIRYFNSYTIEDLKCETGVVL